MLNSRERPCVVACVLNNKKGVLNEQNLKGNIRRDLHDLQSTKQFRWSLVSLVIERRLLFRCEVADKVGRESTTACDVVGAGGNTGVDRSDGGCVNRDRLMELRLCGGCWEVCYRRTKTGSLESFQIL